MGRRAKLNELEERVDELERGRQEDHMLLNALPVMIWYKDTHNRLMRINRQAAELEGLPVSYLEGKSCEELYPADEAEAYYKDDLEVINSKEPKMGILEKHTTGLGDVTWLETSKIPVFDAKGNVKGVIAVAMDVTVRQKKLADAADTLREIKAQLAKDAPREQLVALIDEKLKTLPPTE